MEVAQALAKQMDQRFDELNQSLIQRHDKLSQSLIQKANELGQSLVPQNNELYQSLIWRVDEGLDRRCKNMNEDLGQRCHALDQILMQRFDELDERLTRRSHNADRAWVQQQFDKLNDNLEVRDRGIRREFKNTFDRFARVDVSIYNVHIEISGLGGRMDKSDIRMIELDTRVDTLDDRMNQLDSRMGKLETCMKNLEGRMDKLEHRMDKLEVRMDKLEFRMDKLDHRLGSVEYRSRRFYDLQEARYSSELRTLIQYYRIEEDAISAATPYDSDWSPSRGYTEDDLVRAIRSNAWAVVQTLSVTLGIDCDALHDRVAQAQFHQERTIVTQESASDMSRGRRKVGKERIPIADLIRTVSNAQREAVSHEHSEPHTELGWEADSEKFQLQAGPRLRDNENHGQKEHSNESHSSRGQLEHMQEAVTSYHTVDTDIVPTLQLEQWQEALALRCDKKGSIERVPTP
ncbi:hypothetical protein BBP40_009642 [Aspergillus hancockii]|nr:hypothetical protein BBP40_009642 [Aspergillus hancockii]